MVTRGRIRELLLEVWGEQSCQNPLNWPDALAAMMAPGTNKRGSFKPWVDHAVEVIGAQMDAGKMLIADDIHRAFSKLDVRHRNELLLRLRKEGRETR